MKRASLLILSVLFALCGLNAQTIVLSEDFSGVADTNTSIALHLDNYTQVPGWTGNWVYSSTQKVRVGKSTEGGFIMTPPLNLSGNNGGFAVTFDVKAWNNDQTRMYVEVNGVDYLVEGLSTTQFNTYTLTFTGGTTATAVKFKSYQDTKARFFLDNILIVSQAAGPDTVGPVISNVLPNNNTLDVVFNEPLDQVSAETVGNYSLNNNISVTAASMNGSVVTLTVSPALTEGNSYTLTVSNVADVAGNVMSPNTMTFTYGVAPEFQVANIAALRAKWTDPLDINGTHFGNDIYKLTGHVIVTGINESYRHQIFIQDATGAIVIDDQNNLIISALESGDEITNIYGKLTDYYGLLQFAVAEEYNEPALSIYNDVTPLTVTLTDLQDVNYMNSHQSELLRMEDVTITPTTPAFENGKKYTLNQNGQTGNGLWIHFYNIPGITGEPVPTSAVNLTGVNKISYGEYFLIPRVAADLGTGLPQYLTENDLVVYPNPVSDQLTVSLRTDAFQVTNMAVYDINGKLVHTQAVNDNQIEMSTRELASGNYFLRLSDGKNSVTTKFVKR